MTQKTKSADKQLPASDSDLFRQAVGDVIPVKTDTADIHVPKPPARARQQEADDQKVIADMLSDHHDYLETGEEISFHQPGIQKSILRKLRKGQYRIEACLDLHGYTSEQARQKLGQFIQQSRDAGYRSVQIIHGKGLSNSRGPTLKPLVNSWMRQKSEILAFCSCRPQDGGSGAVYVLVKQRN